MSEWFPEAGRKFLCCRVLCHSSLKYGRTWQRVFCSTAVPSQGKLRIIWCPFKSIGGLFNAQNCRVLQSETHAFKQFSTLNTFHTVIVRACWGNCSLHFLSMLLQIKHYISAYITALYCTLARRVVLSFRHTKQFFNCCNTRWGIRVTWVTGRQKRMENYNMELWALWKNHCCKCCKNYQIKIDIDDIDWWNDIISVCRCPWCAVWWLLDYRQKCADVEELGLRDVADLNLSFSTSQIFRSTDRIGLGIPGLLWRGYKGLIGLAPCICPLFVSACCCWADFRDAGL